MSKRLFAMLTLIPAAAVVAHPGHGSHGGSFSLIHYLSEPLHLASGIAVVSLLIVGCLRRRARHSLSTTPNDRI